MDYADLIKKDLIEENQNASMDTIYTELYAEMRRFRDYELSISTWYITILAAILAGVLLMATNDKTSIYLSDDCLKYVVIIFVTLITISGIFSVEYVSYRFKTLREYVDKCLEPRWNTIKIEDGCFGVRPLHGLLITQALFCLLIIIILEYPQSLIFVKNNWYLSIVIVIMYVIFHNTKYFKSSYVVSYFKRIVNITKKTF